MCRIDYTASIIHVLLVGSLFACDAHCAESSADGGKPVVLSPKQIDEPFLAQRIFPDDSRRHPGNAAVVAMRLCCEKNPDAWEQLVRNSKLHIALSKENFSAEQARADVPSPDIDELRRAAFCREADWEYPVDANVPHEEIVISDAADLQVILRGLAVHCRADIADGDLTSALDKLTSGLGMVAHLQNTSLPISKMLQAKNLDMYLDVIEEAIQHESAPNLYWALTALPDPLIDIQSLPDWIRRGPWRHIRALDDLNEKRSEEQWRSIRLQMGLFTIPTVFFPGTPDADEVRQRYRSFVQAGRTALSDQPELRTEVGTMSDDEVAVRHFIHQYMILGDAYVRAFLLPPKDGLPLLRQSMREFRSDKGREIGDMIPNLSELYLSVWDNRRRIAALRVVEAIRNHAARHERLPNSLGDIEELPIPDDPVTGRPFIYEAEDDDTANISGPAMELPDNDPVTLHYRLRIRQE